jgi:mannosyltransferase OCH1-like enzyme
VRRTVPTGISNDAMGSIPRHPFFLKAIDSLPDYNRRWVLPYITVMASTGPLYLSLIWRHYSNTNPQGMDRLRILFPDEYNNHPWSFFTHHLGNSWHRNDVKLIFWLGSHWVLVTLIGFTVGFALLWCIYSTFILHRQANGAKARMVYSRMPFYRRISSKEHLELTDRHQV